MESPNGNVSSSRAPRGKSLSGVLTGGGAEVFMCSLCAATTCPQCQTTSGVRAGTPRDQCIIDHVPGPGIDPAPRSQFVSSLSQIEVPTQLSENLCFERARITHTYTLAFNRSQNLLISITSPLNQGAIAALPPANLS